MIAELRSVPHHAAVAAAALALLAVVRRGAACVARRGRSSIATRRATAARPPPSLATPQVRWTFSAGDSIISSSPVIGPDGAVYVGRDRRAALRGQRQRHAALVVPHRRRAALQRPGPRGRRHGVRRRRWTARCTP